uniref:cytochrome c oxidase subunit 3 n=1 Tax=Phellinidium ferrugineofuscum TaxID=167367 RepID=UPI0023AAF233|nr:cytochrome c oxidase subunit 3 [Phellinidium ferrugineofuscum]WCF76814.1 cytochrome c oxidase subunit 3 [Phellinidium ferrugineofuscum]
MNISINRRVYQSHPYHLVDPSPWPISTSFALLVVTIPAVMYMHGFQNGGQLLNLGIILLSTGICLWLRDIIVEGTYLGHHTEQVKKGLTIGFTLFIISELMAFFSVFWAYFHSSLSPTVEIGGSWPPLGLEILDPFAIPLLNTILLLSSGAFITYAHHAIIKGNRRSSILGLFLTLVFATIFTALQYYEYLEAGFTIADSVYGTVFFASTGLHGFHVIIGTLFIGVQFIRILNHHITTTHHIGLESSIAYWHFVDVVWLFLYAFVYLWSAPNL